MVKITQKNMYRGITSRWVFVVLALTFVTFFFFFFGIFVLVLCKMNMRILIGNSVKKEVFNG